MILKVLSNETNGFDWEYSDFEGVVDAPMWLSRLFCSVCAPMNKPIKLCVCHELFLFVVVFYQYFINVVRGYQERPKGVFHTAGLASWWLPKWRSCKIALGKVHQPGCGHAQELPRQANRTNLCIETILKLAQAVPGYRAKKPETIKTYNCI